MKDRFAAFLNIITILMVSCTTQPASETTTLNLGNQKLLTIPDSVFTLTKLEYLSLGNSFVMYPPLSALSNGTDGNDSLNRIREIPEEIGNLQQLKALDLGAQRHTKFTGKYNKIKKVGTA